MGAEYDYIAEKYEKFFNKKEYKSEDLELVKLMPNPKGQTILDVGCGTGTTLEMLEMTGAKDDEFEYLGIDPSGKMLEIFSKKFKDVMTVKSTFEDFDNHGQRFSMLVSTYASMSYVVPSAVTRIKDVLSAGSKFFIVFNKDGYEPITHSLDKKIEWKTYGFSEYLPYLKEISKDLKVTEWHNYMIAEGTV